MILPSPSSLNDILVVCSGNICRSPMAAGLLRAGLQKAGVRGKFVHSAGTIATAGNPASPEAVEVMEERGLDISYHRSTPLSTDLIKRADLIITMEQRHITYITTMVPEATGKTFRLTEWAGEAQRDSDVPDPYGMGVAYYELICSRMKRMVDTLIRQFRGRDADQEDD
ncbi:MAG: low molecular weight protein arginine phosphatase [Myxococcales bacterium]|nr:low molecular weight protein arginine phosphatase [Myxococcales bacterium]